MEKEIVKIIKDENGRTDMIVQDNINVADLYMAMVDSVAILSDLMLDGLDDVKYHKFKKSLIESFTLAIENGYDN